MESEIFVNENFEEGDTAFRKECQRPGSVTPPKCCPGDVEGSQGCGSIEKRQYFNYHPLNLIVEELQEWRDFRTAMPIFWPDTG